MAKKTKSFEEALSRLEEIGDAMEEESFLLTKRLNSIKKAWKWHPYARRSFPAPDSR